MKTPSEVINVSIADRKLTPITASSLCAAVTAIDYRLAAGAIEYLGCEDACEVFATALLSVFPGASVTVDPASEDESRGVIHGEVDGEAFAIFVRDGSVSIGTGVDVAYDADRYIGDCLDAAWVAAVKAAHKLA